MILYRRQIMNALISRKSAGRRLGLTLFIFIALMLALEIPIIDIPQFILVPEAQAVVGRPATPGSVAGVRRRTRRRIAIGTRVTALPAGYQTVVVKGATYYVHEDVYYCPRYEGDKLVYVVCDKPAT